MQKSRFIAQGGLLTALSVVLLLAASFIPAGQLALCAAAGVVPAAPLSHRRVRLGVIVYAASLLLSWLIAPRKAVAAAYGVLGLYTIVKYGIESLRRPALEWALKLVYCALAGALALALIAAGFVPALRLESALAAALFFAALFAVFVLYDVAFSKLIGLMRRVFPGEDE